MDNYIIITYCLVDDFCKLCEESQKKLFARPGVQIRKPTRIPKITSSEIITILLVYQRSHFKDFRNFYFRNAYSHFFPNLPTYESFNELQKRVLYLLMLFMKALLVRGSTEGYIDSTKIDVCHLKRSKLHC